jgi:hypothetical protein
MPVVEDPQAGQGIAPQAVSRIGGMPLTGQTAPQKGTGANETSQTNVGGTGLPRNAVLGPPTSRGIRDENGNNVAPATAAGGRTPAQVIQGMVDGGRIRRTNINGVPAYVDPQGFVVQPDPNTMTLTRLGNAPQFQPWSLPPHRDAQPAPLQPLAPATGNAPATSSGATNSGWVPPPTASRDAQQGTQGQQSTPVARSTPFLPGPTKRGGPQN